MNKMLDAFGFCFGIALGAVLLLIALLVGVLHGVLFVVSIVPVLLLRHLTRPTLGYFMEFRQEVLEEAKKKREGK